MTWTMLLALAGMGVVAGILAGLLGVGGGLILVPVLVWVMEGSGMTQDVQHLALGTSLAVMVFTSFASVRAHHQHGAVDWAIVRRFAPPIVLGTLLGTQVAGWLPSRELRWFFVLYAYVIALQMLLDAKPKGGRALPGVLGLSGVGGLIGLISSFVGIGGGSMSVPFMTWCNVPIHNAVATSAALGFPIALANVIGYAIGGQNVSGLPPASLGYIWLPALGVIASCSVLTAPLGAKAAHNLPVKQLKRVFASLLFGLAAYMLWKGVSAA